MKFWLLLISLVLFGIGASLSAPRSSFACCAGDCSCSGCYECQGGTMCCTGGGCPSYCGGNACGTCGSCNTNCGGSGCTPNCSGKCGGEADGCGGTCTATCPSSTGTINDCNIVSGACNTGWGDVYLHTGVTAKRVGLRNVSGSVSRLSYPSWSFDGGQNDITWQDHGQANCNVTWTIPGDANASRYCDIQMASHPVSLVNNYIQTDIYLWPPSTASYRGSVGYFRCQGAVTISSGSQTVGANGAGWNSLVVSGGGLYVSGGSLRVAPCP